MAPPFWCTAPFHTQKQGNTAGRVGETRQPSRREQRRIVLCSLPCFCVDFASSASSIRDGPRIRWQRPSSQGLLLPIAIGWICASRIPAPSRHHRAPSKKPQSRPLAGSSRSTKESVLPAAVVRSAIGRRGAWLPQVRRRGMWPNRMGANATAGGGPEATSRMPGILGRQDAAGEGTGSRFFGTGRMAASAVEGGWCRSSTE